MVASDRRIAALRRTTARRERMEDALRATLAKQREEHAQIAAKCKEKEAEIAHARDVLRASQDHIERMMTSGAAFSIPDLNNVMRYADTVADRVRVLERELSALEEARRAKTDEIAKTARTIASNRGRIDMCNRRIDLIRRALENAASDVADEEAEEAALSRRHIARASEVKGR